MLSYAIVVDSQKLFGKMYSLPAVICQLSLGVVLSKSEAVTGDEVLYNKTASFSSFYYWNLDKNVSQDDHAHQCIQWTRVSNAVRIEVQVKYWRANFEPQTTVMGKSSTELCIKFCDYTNTLTTCEFNISPSEACSMT